MGQESVPRHLRIFLASPGDVTDERGLAVRMLGNLPSDPLLRGKITVEAVAWDHPSTKTPFLAGISAQESVIRSLGRPSECDIVVVILWSRLGSLIKQEQYAKPDGTGYYSGTEWEYEDAWQANCKNGEPRILFYHRTNDPDVKLKLSNEKAILDRFDQMKRVEAFLKACHERDGSIPNEYQAPSEFENMLKRHLKELTREILESREMPQSASVPPPPIWKDSPFPGLRAFTDKDAPIFFGRGRETDELIHRLKTGSGFLAVIGASGSGKSSLVWAGLIPRLMAGALEGSLDWKWVRFTPGELPDNPNPIAAFAVSLKSILERHGQSLRDVAKDLQEDAGKLDELVQMMLDGKSRWAELVLFIDQFEELFTLVAPKYRRPFIELLARAAKTEGVRTVVTMRADFYHHCLTSDQLAELLRTGSFPLGAPGIGVLHEMITRPAEGAGLSFEEGLPERILNDTGAESGALALMAFALFELWKARTESGMLTHAAYETFDGVKGAIGKRADDIFNALPDSVQEKLSDVFRDLLEVDEQGVPTRRRAPLREVARSEAAKKLIKKLTDTRLLVTDEAENEGHEPMVEVAHEALFRSWPRLKRWVQDTADDLRLRRQITQLAAYWQAHERQDEHRWPDDRVVEAVGMLDHLGLRPKDFSELERDFLGPLARDRILEEIDDPATPHEQRGIIGVRLSLLGDRRPGVGLRAGGLPDIVWCEVPGGEITLEVEEEKPSRVAKWLGRSSSHSFMVEPFYIAKYPVTYIQYRAFVEAEDGYLNPAWWENLWFQGDKPGKQFNRRDNHPAENVAWLEAVAFYRWLSEKLGYEIRLPTEWEWQQAATGGDPENQYPWGPEWDGSCANIIESELSRSTAVGIYPQGVSPVGSLDMAGNVWEWCLNEYENPKQTGLSGDGRRVLRGGSWFNYQVSARAAYRLNFAPNDRYNVSGFRLACVAPILDH